MSDTRARWLTPDDMAVELNVSRDTIIRYCRMGDLPAKKFGGEWRIHSTALDPPEHKPLIAPPSRRSIAQQDRRRVA